MGEQCSNASSWRPLETLARVAKIRTQTDGFTKTKTRQREFGDASYSTLRYGNGRVSFTDGIRSLDTTAVAVRSVVYQFGIRSSGQIPWQKRTRRAKLIETPKINRGSETSCETGVDTTTIGKDSAGSPLHTGTTMTTGLPATVIIATGSRYESIVFICSKQFVYCLIEAL